MKPTPPPSPSKTSADIHRRLMRATPWLLALAGMALVVRNTGHPGLTWDEPYYIVAGRSYAEALAFRGDTPWRDAWALNHEHPPLAKAIYGVSGLALEDLLGLAAYRLPAALFFAALIALVFKLVRLHFGFLEAALSAGALLTMPRVAAQAHLAALDLPMALAWTAAVYAFARSMASRRWAIAWGLLLGVAALVKINVAMIPITLLPWALMYHGRRALPNLVAMAIAPAVFVLGWPWLWPWHHPDYIERIGAFLSTGADRFAVPVHYFGVTYHDYRHPLLATYPLVMTALTVPLLTLIGAVIGAVRLRNITGAGRRGLGLYAFSALGVLAIHSVPGVAKYDGVRLFLPAMPFVACLAGVGLARMGRRAAMRGRPVVAALIVAGALTALPVWLWRGHGLTYYNAVTGWTRGAERMGFEVDYWGTGFEADVVDQLAQQARHLGRPVQVRFAGIGELVQRLTFTPGDEVAAVIVTDDDDGWDLLVVSNRKARFRSEEPALALAIPSRRIWTKRLFDGTPLIEIYTHPGLGPMD